MRSPSHLGRSEGTMSKADKDRIITAQRAALRFYSDANNWAMRIRVNGEKRQVVPSPVEHDRGRVARIALLSTIGKRMDDLMTAFKTEHDAVKAYLDALAGEEEEVVMGALEMLRTAHKRSAEQGQMG